MSLFDFDSRSSCACARAWAYGHAHFGCALAQKRDVGDILETISAKRSMVYNIYEKFSMYTCSTQTVVHAHAHMHYVACGMRICIVWHVCSAPFIFHSTAPVTCLSARVVFTCYVLCVTCSTQTVVHAHAHMHYVACGMRIFIVWHVCSAPFIFHSTAPVTCLSARVVFTCYVLCVLSPLGP